MDAVRPKTLGAAVAPVLMGCAIAYAEGHCVPWVAAATITAAVLIQIGTNFANDYSDGVKGTDTPERLGPVRATAAGLVTPGAMRRAAVLAFAAAAAVGALLVTRGGWPIAAIGLSGILFGVLYTGGPRPLGYLGLGDVLVLIYFGPLAVAGTTYLHTLTWEPAAWIAGLAPGCLATALLAVNNLRDCETDRRANKGTLAVRLGAGFAIAEIHVCVLVATLVTPLMLWLICDAQPPVMLLAIWLLPAALLLHAVRAWQPGDRLLGALEGIGKLLVLYALLFVLLWTVGGGAPA